LLLAGFRLALFFNLEDGGGRFMGNISELPSYTALHPR
jgi:hypothetical protein